MPDSKHTPGPWKACRSHEDFNGPMFDIDEEDKSEYDSKPYVSIEARDTTVANSHDLFEFTEANAHLIAAAPDLLEACKIGLEWISGVGNAFYDRMSVEEVKILMSSIEKIKQAISKAEGDK